VQEISSRQDGQKSLNENSTSSKDVCEISKSSSLLFNIRYELELPSVSSSLLKVILQFFISSVTLLHRAAVFILSENLGPRGDNERGELTGDTDIMPL
jgi:hypothetical protein